MPRLVVYHAGALGDFITALPALRDLQRRALLELWTRPAHAALAAGAGLTLAGGRDAGGPALAPWFGAMTGHRAALAELTLAPSAFLFCAPGSPLASNLRAAGLAVTTHAPRPLRTSRVVDYHLGAASGLTGSAPGDHERLPRLRILDRWREDAAVATPPGGPRRRLVLAPGSGSVVKNWPLPRYVALAAQLRGAGTPIAWLLGPSESAIASTAALPTTDAIWSGLAVTTVAALLEGSWGFVGNDSGTSHLAAAVGAATVALFGPTDAAVWAPAGVRVKVVVAGNVPAEMERISVATVFAACQERFEAPPTA